MTLADIMCEGGSDPHMLKNLIRDDAVAPAQSPRFHNFPDM